MTHRALRIALWVFSLGVLLLSAGRTADAAAGTIEGRLVNGTPGGANPAHLPLTLEVYRNEGLGETLTASSDDFGAFRFDGLSTAPEMSYALQTEYLGVPYRTERLRLAQEPQKRLDLRVYETTESAAAIAIERTSLVLNAGEATNSLLGVLELVSFVNGGDRTYIGVRGGQGERLTLQHVLPSQAFDVALGHGFDQAGAFFTDRGLADSLALPPGRREAIFSYRLAYSGLSFSLLKQYLYPVAELRVLVPQGVRSRSQTLTPLGEVEVGGQSYRVWEGRNLAPEVAVDLELEGLPLGARQASLAAEETLRWATPVLALVLLVTALGYGLRGSQREASAAAALASSWADLERRKEELLRSLARLDESYAQGEVPAPEYQKRRSQEKERLLILWRHLKELEGVGRGPSSSS